MTMNSLFSWMFFCGFPERANTAFSKRFPTELRWMPWKHDVRRLFSCSTKTLVYSFFSWTFFNSLPEPRESRISKRFHTELLMHIMVNGKKTCSSTIFLLHETLVNSLFSGTFACCSPTRPNDAFSKCFTSEMLTVNAMKTRCSSIVIIISCSRSCSRKTPVVSLSNLSNRPQVSMVYKLINHAGCW